MCLYLRRNMCPMQNFLLLILICAFPSNLWGENITQGSSEGHVGNMTGTVLHDSQLSPLDAVLRANKVNLIALETFGELNQFWGNVIRLLLPVSEQIEHGLLSFIRKIFPQIFGDLNPSDIAIDRVTRPPDQSNLLIKELIDAFMLSLAKANFTL
ncbi:Uncharacterized protein BM_BM18021 [Brugia malayi]|uniref:Uncharacterized protein n=1 Tax=Brugia malayi TaxID=6279 RepID=A0A4E9EX77_BRUMA|nr:Uncharacterized protein BM_BM18021 [Brugia malayi]VIO88539.1 Uncharacterized protein BM_BM18021 [Brugia malayi]